MTDKIVMILHIKHLLDLVDLVRLEMYYVSVHCLSLETAYLRSTTGGNACLAIIFFITIESIFFESADSLYVES